MSHMLLIPFITWLLWFLSIKRSNGVLLKAFLCFLIFAFKSRSCWNLLASTHISLPVRWDGRRKLINKLDLAVFFDNLNIRTPLTRDISLLATVTREITVDLHDSLLYWIPVKWFLVFWGIFICRTTTEQSSNPSSSSEQNLTGSVHDLNIISQRRTGEETLSFLHIYGLTASPALRLLISKEGNNARGFLDFLVSLLMQFCLSEEH